MGLGTRGGQDVMGRDSGGGAGRGGVGRGSGPDRTVRRGPGRGRLGRRRPDGAGRDCTRQGAAAVAVGRIEITLGFVNYYT